MQPQCGYDGPEGEHSMLKEFLDRQPDRKRRWENWLVVREPTKYCAARYWMVNFPRRDAGNSVAFLCEHGGEVCDVTNPDKPLSNDDLQFWFDAQRQPGDW